jgi:hypothetical protein
VLGQVKINENISKKFLTTDKILESIDSKMESFSYAMKKQLSFNKMIETQVAQLAASLPSNETWRIPRQPKNSPCEQIKVVTTRRGKTTRDPPYPTNAAGKNKEV